MFITRPEYILYLEVVALPFAVLYKWYNKESLPRE